MNRIINFWINLRASLWFIPGLMIAGSIALALGLIELEPKFGGEWLSEYPRLFGLGADGSRGMLTAIASSMLTVATLAFSLTLNSVTQASGQFTPRIFRNFMRDRANQFVLGYFVSVFAYCLIVLRTIRGGDELKFVPSLAVIAGLFLALGGIVVLIFFIHHIAASLQISTIIENIVEETKDSIEQMFPEEMGGAADEWEKEEIRAAKEYKNWLKIRNIEHGGYIQSIDNDGLLKFAEKNNVYLRMEYGIGHFVVRGAALVSVAPEKGNESLKVEFGDEETEEINSYFAIERHRTIEQDTGFGIRQIVDIALKALSPGVNDTTTAVNCIDFLSEIVSEIARRRFPARVREKDGVARVLAVVPDFQSYVETAFDQIRISGKANLAVFIRLVEGVAFVAESTDDRERLLVLEKQLDLIEEFAARTLETEYEKEKFRRRLAEKRKTV